MHGPCVVRSISIQSPFNCRLTSVFLKRSSVKRTVHGRFFWAHTVHVFHSRPHFLPSLPRNSYKNIASVTVSPRGACGMWPVLTAVCMYIAKTAQCSKLSLHKPEVKTVPTCLDVPSAHNLSKMGTQPNWPYMTHVLRLYKMA